DSDEDGENRCPLIGLDSQHRKARVDANGFDKETADAVPDEVHPEELAPARLPTPLDGEKHDDADDIPNDLVEECRVKECSLRKPDGESCVVARDFEPPGQCGGATEEFIV